MPVTSHTTGQHSDSATVHFAGNSAIGADPQLQIRVVDADGFVVSEVRHLAVSAPAPENAVPVALVTSAAGSDHVTVQVDDPEDDDVTVALDELEDGTGLAFNNVPPKVVPGGHGEVTLSTTLASPAAPNVGDVYVLVGDEHGAIVKQKVRMRAEFKWPKDDALYAIPLQTDVHARGQPAAPDPRRQRREARDADH